MKWVLGYTGIALIAFGIFIFYRNTSPNPSIPVTDTMEQFKLKTSAFKEGDTIPKKFTCDGDDINPLLEIRNVPEGAKSMALIMDDPDASRGVPFDHWIVFNIDPKTQYISEDNVPANAVLGANSWGKPKYGGPCPPQGKPAHRYVFTLYALDVMLELTQGATKADLQNAMEPHIIAHTSIMGTYGR